MLARILGSGAAGAFPQWNCNCRNCGGLRRAAIKARARTQSSLAVSDRGRHWVLFNASPDIRVQIESFAPLQPQEGVRGTGVAAIVPVDAQMHNVIGMLMLREGKALEVYTTEVVREELTSRFPVFTLLSRYCGVNWHQLDPASGGGFAVPECAGLRFTAVAVQSKAPPYSPHRHDPHPGDTIALWVEDLGTGRSLLFAPACGQVSPGLRSVMERSDCVMVDGTFWENEEMAATGLTDKQARAIGHLPQSGPGGMLGILAELKKPRKILTPINNTNPILDEASPERRQVEESGVEVAYDGLEVVL